MLMLSFSPVMVKLTKFNYELPLTLKNDNDSNVSVQDYSQHPNNQQQQPLLLHPISNFFMAHGMKKEIVT